MMDDGIARAIRIGQKNAEVLTIAQNWCAHLETQLFGGIGLVEAETGLPIGSRSFKCIHASAAGMAGMDLEHIALDFYDRNCRSCDKRVPVRMPNLGDLVYQREEAAKEQARAAALARDKRQEAYDRRHASRELLKQQCDEVTGGILDTIASLDREANPETAKVFRQLATVAPERFNREITDSLFALANDTDSPTVLDAVLNVLLEVNADPSRLCELALKRLPKMALPIAGRIVASAVSSVHVPLIPAAIPALVRLAGPIDSHFFGTQTESHPDGLRAVYGVDPDAVICDIESDLRCPEKPIRIRAVNAVQILRKNYPECGLSLVRQLVTSLQLPDDHYGGLGSAEGWVQDLLADLLESNFDRVDPELTAAFGGSAFGDAEGGLHQIYLRLFREHRHGRERIRGNSSAHAIIFARLIDLLSTKCAAQGSTELLEFLRHDAEHYPDLLEQHIDGLLGAIAILSEERTSAVQSFLQLDLPPNPLAAFEASSRKQHLYWLVDATAKLIGKAAAERPNTIGDALLSTLEKVDEAHETLRSSLVEALGMMATNRHTLPRILPALYSSMTGRSQLVRSSAVQAYGDVIGRNPDDLPPLLHETFLALLTDPYIIVHQSAVDVLDHHRLPHEYDAELELRVLNIIGYHGGTEGRTEILKTALEVFLDFQAGKSRPMRDQLTDWIIERIRRCNGYDAADLLRRHASKLWTRPLFMKVLLSILSDPEANEYRFEDLIDVLSKLPPAQIQLSADELVEALKVCCQSGHDSIDIGVEILTAAGLWEHAAALSEFEESRWSDSVWDRPRRLAAKARVLNCLMEQCASKGDIGELRAIVARIRSVGEEIKRDEEEHRYKRDPLFGFTDPN